MTVRGRQMVFYFIEDDEGAETTFNINFVRNEEIMIDRLF